MAISGVGSSSSNSSSAVANELAATSNNSQFVSENEFLTLLVAQLENQDPLNPQDPTQFVSELASFSSLTEMTQMNQNFSSVLDNSAVSLIGQTVTVADSSAQSGYTTGVVSGVVYYSNTPAVQVDGVNYPLSAIQNVGSVSSDASTGG